MKNSAKWEVRVGLLLGLAFIMAFGMILSELRDPVTQPAASEKETAVNTAYYQSAQPSLERETYLPENEHIDPVPVAPPQQSPIASREVRVDMEHLQPATISREADPIPTGPQPQRPVRQEPQNKTYRVIDGDTLYEIAEKEYGAGKGSMWRKIYEANRNKLSNPSAIKPGQTLVIPSLTQVAALPASDASQREALDHMQRYVTGSSAVAPEPSHSTARAKVHVVKSGDNLTRIARKYFNDSSNASISKIFEANRDQLNDRNDVAIGMKLRIPAD